MHIVATQETFLWLFAMVATFLGVPALLTLAIYGPVLRRTPKWEVTVLVALSLLGVAGVCLAVAGAALGETPLPPVP